MGLHVDQIETTIKGGFKMPEELKLYDDGECRHDHTFNRNGVWTCIKCGMVYNEELLMWENQKEGD